MNTFVCEPTFEASARALDRARLGKQRLEVWQMLRALTGATQGWASHPAVRMWAGHPRALARFGLACHDEWIRRGYVDTTRPRLADLAATLPDTGNPWWVGDPTYLMSVRSVLIGKDQVHYRGLWPDVPVGVPAYWPVPAAPVLG